MNAPPENLHLLINMSSESTKIQSASCRSAERCRLLELPLELQLVIYELVVVKPGPLLLNWPCNSSYQGKCRYKLEREEQEAWKAGEKCPPLQPALSRTCRFIRAETLPIFYGENLFRACYCHPDAMLSYPTGWLRIIGRRNRETLRHLYFYDRNQGQDRRSKGPLEKLKTCEIFTAMEGKMETLSGDNCCAHLVTFGDWERRDGDVPLGFQRGGLALRMEGEP